MLNDKQVSENLDDLDIHKKRMLEALIGRLGNVTKAAHDANVGRSTHYHWMVTDEDYKAAVEDITEMLIDHVEDKLLQRVNGVEGVKYSSDGQPITYEIPPDTTAIIFFLKTRAKKRGYIEKNEIDLFGKLGITWEEVKTYDPDEKTNEGN